MDIFNLAPILSLSNEPDDAERFNEWIEQTDVYSFLENEIQDENIILFASLPNVFINTALVPAVDFDAPAIEDLLEWNHTPDSSWGEVYSSEKVWIESPLGSSSSELLKRGEQIIFRRDFAGFTPDRDYYEFSQKIAHILGIHFMPERDAWCKLDELGDIEDVVKIIKVGERHKRNYAVIISIQQEALGKYAALTDSVLLRMFDFTRYKGGNFNGWHKGTEKLLDENNIFGRLVVESGYASYARGVQIADIRIDTQKFVDEMWSRSEDETKYATFTIFDWKNNVTKEVSCNPAELGNYFVESDLPFELSPVFFKPEVLLKYKSDREKYQLRRSSVSCRDSWHLETFDVNEAGQVHTYIGYLNRLPFEEQLHWKQYNEAPKAPISERAYKRDFENRWDTHYNALASLKRKLYELDKANVDWWKLRDPNAPDKVHYPYSTSTDEWADEILHLDQLLVEGFEEKWLRKKSEELGRLEVAKFRSLKLLEECLVGVGFEVDHAREILSAFHEVHNLRSKVKGHTSGQEAVQFRKDALREFRTFRKHFENLCAKCDESLEIIINAFKGF